MNTPQGPATHTETPDKILENPNAHKEPTHMKAQGTHKCQTKLKARRVVVSVFWFFCWGCFLVGFGDSFLCWCGVVVWWVYEAS